MKNNRKPGTPIIHSGEVWIILGFDKKSDLYLVRSLDRKRELYLSDTEMTSAP